MMGLALLAMACLPVEGDRILARDLLPGWPALAVVAADTPLGYSPVAGTRRVFRAGELARLAARHGVAPPQAAEMCVEHPTEPLTAARVEEALRVLFPGARIAVGEVSRYPVPHGELVFPRQGWRPGAMPLWRGYVRYGRKRRFAVWARAGVTVERRQVRAMEKLPPGEPVTAAQVREETVDVAATENSAAGVADVVGRRPRRAIPAGALITAALLTEARDVERGQVVRVRVASGAAQLELEARAETAGNRGETIRVRNPASKKIFTARVEGQGVVAVEAGRIP